MLIEVNIYFTDDLFFTECEEYLEQVSRQITYVPLIAVSKPVSITVSECDANNVQLIVGGEEAKVGEFPHMVNILIDLFTRHNFILNLV